MAAHRPRDFEQRVRSLKKRLALDFQPLRDTLSHGLDVLIDAEAAVLCTATVEALCDALFHVVVKNLHDEAAASLAPLDTKITVYHLHVALRTHNDFAQLLVGVESAAAVLECFLDDASSRALYDRHVLSTPEAKHLRPALLAATATTLSDVDDTAHNHVDHELLVRHERTRSEWQKREDDPFSDVDFAMVLKCVHPAFTLTHSAALLLSALVRELLNAACDMCDLDRVERRVPPELYVEDLAAPLARVFHATDELRRAIGRTAREALERYRLRSRQGATLTLRCRVFTSGASASRAAATYAVDHVARDAPFGPLLFQMCKKCRVDAASHVGVYRGHTVDATATPRILGMPTGAVVYLVRTKWWDHVRRNDARRGLLLPARVAAPAEIEWPCGKKTLGKNLGVHTASASRLMGVGGEGGDRRRGEQRGARSDGEDDDSNNSATEDGGGEQEQEQEEEDDSLGRLLRQRQQQGNNQTVRHGQRRRDQLATMATQSAQLMDTLDEAWLGFAGISASVRTIKESLQRQLDGEEEEEEERGRGTDALENELRVRLEKTGELVRQTSLAHELVAQLLQGTKRLRADHPPRG